MFGLMTEWLKHWKKTQFVNTTEDLLACFTANNNDPNSFFYFLTFSPSLWTSSMNTTRLKMGPSKNIFSFLFESKSPGGFQTLQLNYVTEVNTGWKGLKEYVQTRFIQTETWKSKKTPKYSKQIEVTNSGQITASDWKLLNKKATQYSMEID